MLEKVNELSSNALFQNRKPFRRSSNFTQNKKRKKWNKNETITNHRPSPNHHQIPIIIRLSLHPSNLVIVVTQHKQTPNWWFPLPNSTHFAVQNYCQSPMIPFSLSSSHLLVMTSQSSSCFFSSFSDDGVLLLLRR